MRADLGEGRHSDLGEGRHSDLGEGRHSDLGEGRHSDLGEGRHSDLDKGRHSDLGEGRQGRRQAYHDEGQRLAAVTLIRVKVSVKAVCKRRGATLHAA